jgi:hypothetical protein
MSNNNAIPIVGLEKNLATDAPQEEVDDREKVKDPDANADDVESAEADRVAVEPDDDDNGS